MTSTALSETPPMTAAAIAQLAHKVISSYPSVRPLELKGYLAELIHLLAKYREAVARAAVDQAMLASPSFPPPVPLVAKHCEDLKDSGVEWVRQWDARAAEQLAERAEYERKGKAESTEHRAGVTERLRREIAEAFAEGRGEPFNVFVPTFAPRYRAMVDRGGRPGVSVEDTARKGVWVPMSWLGPASVKPRQPAETPATVQAKYNLTEEQWNALPDAPPKPRDDDDHWESLGIG